MEAEFEGITAFFEGIFNEKTIVLYKCGIEFQNYQSNIVVFNMVSILMLHRTVLDTIIFQNFGTAFRYEGITGLS